MPFAAPGRAARIEGRAAVLAFTRAGHAGLPFRFDGCRVLLSINGPPRHAGRPPR